MNVDYDTMAIVLEHGGGESAVFHPLALMRTSHLAARTSLALRGEAIWRQARYPEAKKLVHEALDGRQRSLGPNHPATLASMNNLGLLLRGEGRYAEAEKLFRQLLDTQRRAVGPSDDATLNAEVALALVLATFRRKNALSDIGRVTLRATDIVCRGDFARVHSRARGEWTVPA